MSNSRSVRLLFLLCSMLPVYYADASITIKGNSDGPESFTFPLGSHIRNPRGTSFYVGALNPDVAKEYAISRVFVDSATFEPFAPETVTIDCQDDQANPLYDAAIAQLDLFGFRQPQGLISEVITNPMAVTQAEPANIYFVDQKVGNNCLCLLSAKEIKDATGIEVTRGIIALEGLVSEGIFAAVKPNDSDTFGDLESGIAVIALQGGANEDGEQIPRSLVQIDAQPGPPPTPTATRAAALDVTSDVLKIGADLASIGQIVDMHFSPKLLRLYIALQVQAGADPADGARAIVVGRMEDQKLLFESITPEAVCTDQNKIVGGIGANAQISIFKVRTMHTSMRLDYLIVLGNNGDPASTQRSVFALPLVNTLFDPTPNLVTQGTLANVTLDPTDVFTQPTDPTLSPLLVGRAITQPATTPLQVYTNLNVQAAVGGGDIPFGDITDINVVNDTVFVSVADTINNEKSGIFYSQALFDNRGVISAWTPWQRMAGTTDKVFGFSYEVPLGTYLWMTGDTDQTVQTVKRTQWGMGDEACTGDLVSFISELLVQTRAGVQGFFDLPPNVPGLFDISLNIATGLQQVVLIESGQVNGGVLCPNKGDFRTDAHIFTDGMITQNFPVGNTRVVSIAGGVLDDIGVLIAATIGIDDQTNEGYLFVGGSCGLAVLAQENGDGWDTALGLGKNFAGLVDGMRFIELGDYCFVRKLIVQDSLLFVLTDTQLDRIDIANSDFATGQLDVATIAMLEDIMRADDGTLLDVTVSDKFALLAASTGLYRVGNDADIRTAVDNEAVNWTRVAIPEGITVAQFLQPIASNNLPNGFAKTDNGQLYLLDAYRGFDIAYINRYTIQSVFGTDVNDMTIVPLPDMRVENVLTTFRNFGNYRNLAIVDGTDIFSSQDRNQCDPPFVQDRNRVLPLGISDANLVSAIVRSSASGSWIVAGDFGLRINE